MVDECLRVGFGVKETSTPEVIQDRIVYNVQLTIYDLEHGVDIWTIADCGEAALSSEFAARTAYTIAFNRIMMKFLPESFNKALNYLTQNYQNPKLFDNYKSILEKRRQLKKVQTSKNSNT